MAISTFSVSSSSISSDADAVTTSAVGLASGTGAAAAASTSTATVAGVGSASGTGATTATGTIAGASIATASGSGVATAVGTFIGISAAVGRATATGAAAGISPTIPSAITTTAVAGTRLYIGGHADFLVSPDSAPWIEIGNVFTIGPYRGINFTKINLESIGDGYTRKIKGSAFAPPFDVVLNRDDADTGQAALKTALADRNFMWNFKIEETDTVTVLARTFFRGQVFGFTSDAGSANDVKRINAMIEVNPSTIINT